MSNFQRGNSRGSHGQNRGNRSGGGGGYQNRGRGGSQKRGRGGYQNRGRYQNKGIFLNPLMFVKKAVNVIEVAYTPKNSFSDFLLDETVKKNVLSRGYDVPTPVQDESIPAILEGRDLVGIANTGTGKTAAFLLPLITKVAKDRSQKVLIVTPTRELAAQIQDEFKKFSVGMNMYSTLCIGGASINVQFRELSRRPNFVIGTPGRIKDLENRRRLDLRQYQNVVLDEVDRMLDMGFINDIREIISLLPHERQSLFFSATLPEKIKAVMQTFLVNPVMVQVKNGNTASNVDQDIIRTKGRDKVEILHQLLIKQEFKKVLVFGRTKWGVNKLEINLTGRGFKATSIHGNKSQGQRSRALRMLKNSEVQVLLATDVASRGIDVEDITHVINYDVPETYDDYVHRIGRTGRAGKKGVALTFID
jgi:ATP-dependent RNA helicase RhlE